MSCQIKSTYDTKPAQCFPLVPIPKEPAQILCITYDAPEPNIHPPYTPSRLTSMVAHLDEL